MKHFRINKKLAISGLALVVAIVAGGVAYAYFSSPGTGVGAAQAGTTTPVLIDQLGGTPMYNSRTDGTAYQYSQCFYCVQMGDFGNRVNLANGGGPLSDVVVDMANFDSFPSAVNLMHITMNIYAAGSGSTPGSLLASDEQAFNIPDAPDGGYNSVTCQAAQALNPDSDCGIANFSITFNFASQDVTLPSEIVYDIQYNDAADTADSGVNVQLAQESTEVSVGSDADPGNLFMSLASSPTNGYNASYNDVGPGEITCSTVSATFEEYNTTTTCDGGHQGYGTPSYVPAVEIDTSTMGDLYPGGPSQPVNFSMTNTGSTPETVNDVTITVATNNATGDIESIPGNLGTDVGGCQASWFTVTSPVTVDATIPAGGVIDWVGAASISMPQSAVDQNACQGKTIGLTFTSD